MTAAISGAAQGGAEALLQTGVGRVSRRGEREQSNSSGDSRSQPDETQTPASRTKVSTREPRVNQIEKTAARRRSDDQSDSDDVSFEDTFENVGKDGSTETAQPEASLQSSLPNLVMAQLLPSGEKTQTEGGNSGTQGTSQAAARPGPVLKQASILALMNARDRLLSGVDAATGESAMPQQSLPESDEPTDRILATVDRRETHWNFDGKVMMDAGAKVSELQADRSASAQDAGALATAMANAQKATDAKPTGDDLKTAQSATASNAEIPSLTPGNNGNGAGANSGNQSSQQSQRQINPELAARTLGQDDNVTKTDRVFSADMAGTQPSASVTDQVRNSIVNNLTGSETARPATLQQPDMPRPGTNTVLRTLDLTLSPPDLGSVKLHMSLKDNALSIEAEASKASTAKLLGDDRVNLEKGLRDAGYDLSSMKITDASASSSANSNNWQQNSSPSRDGDQARSNSSGRQDGDAQRRDDGSASDQAQRRAKDNRSQPASSDGGSSRVGNAVYI
jgi:hypothetical protein